MDEIKMRVQCLLAHVQKAKLDGLVNSLSQMRLIEEDGMAIQHLANNELCEIPVHIGNDWRM